MDSASRRLLSRGGRLRPFSSSVMSRRSDCPLPYSVDSMQSGAPSESGSTESRGRPKIPAMADEELDEREDRQQVTKQAAIDEALAMYRERPHAVLSTLSARYEGWPFASVVPYAKDREGRALIYVASIAQHTKNMIADPRVSLFVNPEVDEGEDAQNYGRLTLMARATPVPAGEKADAFARYLAALPVADKYKRTHDFGLWRLDLMQARWIGGFGKIFWMGPELFAEDPKQDPLRASAEGIISHMNADHAEALATYCEAFYGVKPQAARMVGIDRFGFDVEAEARRFRFDFPVPIGPDEARGAIVALLKTARAKLNP